MREPILYGTLGGSCRERDTIRALFRAGMTGARLNLSHAPLDAFAPLLADFWSAAKEEGVRRGLGGPDGADGGGETLPRLVIDLQGPELRVGRLAGPIPLPEGGTAVLIPDSAYPWEVRDTLEGTSIPIPEPALEVLRAGDRVSLDDSALLLEVMETGREKKLSGEGGGHRAGREARLSGGGREAAWDTALCRVLRGGTLLSRKSLAVQGKAVPMPALTAEDMRNLSLAGRFGVTDILQPFVRGREDVEALREALNRENLPRVRIMAKIENRQGLEKLDEIAAAADEICIARGDLGNGAPLWEVPRYQKRIAAACRAAGTPFCVATQLLWSMQARSVPTRAEMCDIYNAVLDGAAGLMLTGETAAGQYPAEAMAYLARAAGTAVEDLAV